MTGLVHTSPGSAMFAPSVVLGPRDGFVDAVKPSPLEWMRSRKAARELRRAEAAHRRAAERLDSLGPDWRVLDLQMPVGGDRMSFLAMGPGGLFAVTVKDHGRSKVGFAGDVVQIDGTRPKYVHEARERARLAADALSRAAGVSVPVMPVLAFAGTGMITFYGMPKGCIVTAYQELDRVLNARGRRLTPRTVDKLYALAISPATRVNAPYIALAERYQWEKTEPQTTQSWSTDKRSARR
jgi:hypothetical protein